ncbi:phosphatase PAP2 family protein [Kaistella sp. G5-32]|uniref:Phosphatase PAP2 family protein n=1 Tax=Kaistella gelatinilytica TaxID=2787636 RepID=A0ABS0FDK1_9FLAO|nr:phosphatase PAP2 family protein [Kaistella gelatinilytica]MBF8457804.1 phosphatase PAP2 family protein [Kaistella gelatinilytica]
MNTTVINNYSKLKLSLFILPLVLLIAIVIFLYSQNSLNAYQYTQIQKNCFFLLNHHLGQFPNLEYNLTQIGDASIFLSFLIIFLVYAPKIWEALISASLVSLVFSNGLKNLFDVPRPAVVYDNDLFIIVGKTAVGYSSLPSGHSITIFTTLTVLLYAFMPKDFKFKFLWTFFIIALGLFIASSRVGVGAHHPLDVIIGSIIGYISGLIGIFISRKYKIFSWVGNKKYFPIFIVLILAICGSLINKIITENVFVFYMALVILCVSLYKIVYVYVKK